MKKEERDILDELIRTKLYNLEADTRPDDWDAIANRLPAVKVSLRRRWLYGIAAAVISLLIISTGIYLIQDQTTKDVQIAEQIEKETHKLESQIKDQQKETDITPVTAATENKILAVVQQPVSDIKEIETFPVIEKEEEIILDIVPVKIRLNNIPDEFTPDQFTDTSNAPVIKQEKKSSSSRWSFGAGAGSLTQSGGSVVNTYVLRSNTQVEDKKLLAMNAVADNGKPPKTNIKHKTPISFGLSASKQLNDRFSLQTGLTYSMLTSDWETQAEIYNKKTRQRLHFIGIPLSVTYKIAEWNKFRFYASAGIQTEVNVAGKERLKSYFENQQIGVDSKSVRMKEWQWSVNARTGVSYPLIRYVSAFAEVGAAYYFDNGSEIETVYSDKEFNVSPQIGIRFGF